jgi:hypothetical protein
MNIFWYYDVDTLSLCAPINAKNVLCLVGDVRNKCDKDHEYLFWKVDVIDRIIHPKMI